MRSKYRRRGITIALGNVIFQWLTSNDASSELKSQSIHTMRLGLATAASVCLTAGTGELVDEFIGIEIGNRTVPHRIHIIDINRGGDS